MPPRQSGVLQRVEDHARTAPNVQRRCSLLPSRLVMVSSPSSRYGFTARLKKPDPAVSHLLPVAASPPRPRAVQLPLVEIVPVMASLMVLCLRVHDSAPASMRMLMRSTNGPRPAVWLESELDS